MSNRFTTFTFVAPIAELIPQFTQLLEHFGLRQTSSGDADLLLDFSRSGQVLDPAKLEAPFVAWQGMTAHRLESEVVLSFRNWQVVVDVSRRRVFPIAVIFGVDDFSDYECRSFFRIALLFFVRRLGFFEIHGGACEIPTGEGVLFLGSSGSGKTSSVLSVLEAGWNFIGDDALLVAASPDTRNDISVRSARNRFSLTAHALGRFPRLGEFSYKAVQRIDKWVFDPLRVWPNQQKEVCHPRFLVFCRIADIDKTTALPLTVGDALGRLMASTPWIALDRETAAEHINVYRSLANSCYSFELHAGRDLLENPRTLVNFLDPEKLRSLHVVRP